MTTRAPAANTAETVVVLSGMRHGGFGVLGVQEGDDLGGLRRDDLFLV
jgi:hypothetical protein